MSDHDSHLDACDMCRPGPKADRGDYVVEDARNAPAASNIHEPHEAGCCARIADLERQLAESRGQTDLAEARLHQCGEVLAESQRARSKQEARMKGLEKALRTLSIDANRLADRNLGGTYEEDVRRSIAAAEALLREGEEP